MAKGGNVTTASPSQDETVRIEKIENGYIVSRESYGGKGGYKCHKSFSATMPEVVIGGGEKVKKAAPMRSALARARDAL